MSVGTDAAPESPEVRTIELQVLAFHEQSKVDLARVVGK